MPGAVTTLSIKDSGGTARTMRVWDESGAGTGPFSFMHVLADGNAGAGVGLAKAEDAQHVSGDFGFMALGVRKDTAVALGADGDYQPPIFDASGRLHTAPIPTGSNTIGTVSLTDISAGEWESVLAGQTAQVLGPTGAAGDYLGGLLIVPATTSPGAVTLLDGSNSPDIALTIFAGGSSSLSNLVPFFVPLGIKSVTGSWRVTTGSNVSVLAVGNFT